MHKVNDKSNHFSFNSGKKSGADEWLQRLGKRSSVLVSNGY